MSIRHTTKRINIKKNFHSIESDFQSFFFDKIKTNYKINDPTFVMISCEHNMTKLIIEKIKSVPIVCEVTEVNGVFDAVTRLESTYDTIKHIILARIRPINGYTNLSYFAGM